MPATRAGLEEYDWRAQWYPACFANDVPAPPEPAAFSIFDEQVVLWRPTRDSETVHCVEDRCPHRLAALSQGGVEPDGTLRCFYHGWQFDGRTGGCVAAPQLPAARAADVPFKAATVRRYPTCTREGIVWVWLVPDSVPSRDPPATPDDLDAHRRDFQIYDYVIDLPYDHTWLVENLVDPAHIPISHDRTEGGGRRELAEPYEMEIHATDASGFVGRFRGENKSAWTDASFEAPGIVRYRNERVVDDGTQQKKKNKAKPPMVFGAALHCVPRGRGRSRLLYRTYFTTKSLPRLALWALALKPKWLRNLNSCKILEQDVGLITSQEDYLRRRPGRALDAECLPLSKSSDAFVIAYRKWLDRVGHAFPYAPVGWATAPPAEADPLAGFPHVSHPAHRSSRSRLHNHVAISQTTRAALRNVVRVRDASLLAFAVATAASAAGAPLASFGVAVASAFTAAGAAKLERCFYRNFDRHKWRP